MSPRSTAKRLQIIAQGFSPERFNATRPERATEVGYVDVGSNGGAATQWGTSPVGKSTKGRRNNPLRLGRPFRAISSTAKPRAEALG